MEEEIEEEIEEYEDKTLTCHDCGTEFVFAAGEQRFYRDKGLSDTHRCQECRATRKAQFMPRWYPKHNWSQYTPSITENTEEQKEEN